MPDQVRDVRGLVVGAVERGELESREQVRCCCDDDEAGATTSCGGARARRARCTSTDVSERTALSECVSADDEEQAEETAARVALK